jgi:PAS domain S-box-containing protein
MSRKNLSKNPMLSPFEIYDNLITFEREEFETIINSVHDGILIADNQGWVLFVNKAFETLTGVNSQEILGSNVKTNLKNGLYSDTVVGDVLATKREVTKMIRFDQEELMVTGIPIMDRKGEPEKIVCTVQNLSELNKMRERLEKSKALNINYERKIMELTSGKTISRSLVGNSAALEAVAQAIQKVSDVDVTVLITGESGTGKGVVAELIHELSSRKEKGAFIHINCGAIPENLMESELFGYEKGAFTGAKKEGKPGLIELAHQGTLFLDEIGELPLNMQVKFLHVLQNKEAIRVGGTKPYRSDVRFVAANHRNLEELCRKGLFRYDLYYRLNVVPIPIPPLRERKTDILALTRHFLQLFNEKYGTNKSISASVLDYLENYSWPGNVRELENIIERMVIMSPGPVISPDDLPAKIRESGLIPLNPDFTGETLKSILLKTEEAVIRRTLEKTSTLAEAADVLGIDLSTLTRKKQKYKIYKRGEKKEE